MRKIATLVLVITLLAAVFAGCGNKTSEENDTSAFQTPEDFEWEGSYIDEEGGMAVLTISKSGKKYECIIDVPDKDVTHIDSYTFTAVEDDAGLIYEDCICTSFDIPDYEDEEDVLVSDEVYTNGTGSLYYVDGYVYWLDDENNAGENFVFVKQDDDMESGDAGK